MDVGKQPYRKPYLWVAAAAALASTPLPGQTARAGQLQCASMITQAVASAAVTQLEDDPEAIFTITPTQPLIGVAFSVDASQSFDRPDNGAIASYAWKWGDGSANTSGVSVKHTYAQAGTYVITLTVTDSDPPPATDTATHTVVIAPTAPPTPGGINHAPTAALTVSPTQAEVGDEITFDATGSRDADSDPLVYRFSFGDGEETDFTSDAFVAHQYDEPGIYSIRLTVRDDQNASVDLTASVSILGPDAGNQAPVALIATGPRTGAAPVTLTFDGRISYDPDGDPISYEWTISRNDLPFEAQTGSVIHQEFDEPGTYSVTLEVRDTEGALGFSDAEMVTVTERSEPVEPPPPAPIPQPEPPPSSAAQRPPAICGVGVLMPMLACLMGLLGKRRFGRDRN